MPILHSTNKVLGCAIAVWHGRVTGAEMQEQLVHLASDPDWPPGPTHLVDGTTLETVSVPDPELLELLYEGTELVSGKIRIAVVLRPEFVAAAPVEHPRASEAFEGAVFADLDSACAYLDLSVAAVETAIHRLRNRLPSP
jgi:hypothetical protein